MKDDDTGDELEPRAWLFSTPDGKEQHILTVEQAKGQDQFFGWDEQPLYTRADLSELRDWRAAEVHIRQEERHRACRIIRDSSPDIPLFEIADEVRGELSAVEAEMPSVVQAAETLLTKAGEHRREAQRDGDTDDEIFFLGVSRWLRDLADGNQ